MASSQKLLVPWNKGRKTGIVPKTAFKKNDKRLIGNTFNVGRVPWNSSKISRTCQYCSESFLWQDSPSNIKKGKGKFCSRICFNSSRKGTSPINKGQKAIYCGNKHWNWKGGITSSDRIQRAKFKNSMQKLIFERDNYTCQMCGTNGIDLQVDHIQSWAEYVELRFSMDNCRTLCAKCHYKITFGKPMPKTVKGWGHNLLKGGKQP